MTHPTFGHGKICYLVIPALDIEESARFYERVFGWRIRRRDDGSVSFDDGVGEVSGTWVAGPRPAAEPPPLSVHIMVLNAGETSREIVANGGEIVQPVEDGASEITALFRDPAGNFFGIYQHGR